MKRSEILELLYIYQENCDDNCDPVKMEEVLAILENAGMQPPWYIPKDVGLVWGNKKNGEPNGQQIAVLKWEPEEN